MGPTTNKKTEDENMITKAQVINSSVYCEDVNVLVCPVCGDSYLHLKTIEVFDRNEDAEKGMHLFISHHETNIKYDTLPRNPSARRNGVRIVFCCEICGKDTPELIISQHKGQTTFGWEEL